MFFNIKKKSYIVNLNNYVYTNNANLIHFRSLLESQLFFNFNTFFDFFNNCIMKKNFLLYVICNDIKLDFFFDFLNFVNFIIQDKYKTFNYNFSLYFFFNLFCFFYYKNPNILLNFLVFFTKNFNYKIQRILHTMMVSIFAFLDTKVINKYGLLGCQVKIKGKFTQRPGDRRKTYFYRIGSFSYANPYNKYTIHHRQLNYKSGSSGCTVILLLL